MRKNPAISSTVGRDIMKADPVLFFDKKTTDSSSTIELLTIDEVSELLKISVTGVRRLQQARRIPFVKIGGCVRFFKNDLLAYLQQQRVESIG